MHDTTIQHKGSAILEAVLALSIISLFIVMFIGTIAYEEKSSAHAALVMRALFVADEGLEATRSIRDDDFLKLADGTYGLHFDPSGWSLVPDPDVTEPFTRTITVSSVATNTKLITATVVWGDNSSADTITLSTRLTNWSSAQ